MNDYLTGYQKGMDDAKEIAVESMKSISVKAYKQGIEHAAKAAHILSYKKYDSIEAFLLELSIELNKLKEPKTETCENL